MRMTLDTEESIRCSVSSCSCVRFKPARAKHRSCDRCGHGWVLHALEKLQAPPSPSCGPVEVALPGLVFDLSSLVLYGAQAVPVRLKILLDRLFSVLTPEQVGHILHTLGWSLGDYVRGYMLQFPGGTVLDRWVMVTPEEEPLVLRQFLRFGETRPIVELMMRQCPAAVNRPSDPELRPAPKSSQSNICTFPERDGGTAGSQFRNSDEGSHLVAGVCCSGKSSVADCEDTIHHFENFTGGLSLLLPFHFPSSAFQCLAPPAKDLVAPLKLTLPKLSGTKLGRRARQDGEQVQEKDPILPKSKGEPALRIKTDPDKPNPPQSLWQPNPRIHSDGELDRHMDQQENTSSSCPSLSSSFIPMSSSLRSSMSSSYQKLQVSSPSSFHPLPSFSSSFLCPLPASSFPSSLCPLPSLSSSLHSPCSLPSSPAGGRKGRVCCGVCGKSFYDKGTLKIHYNAVHLKIKHRCTVAGCTMVFSSLRSRNRHSANPNPRLHTGSSRDAHSHQNTQPDSHTRKTDIGNTRRDDDARTPVHVHNLRNGLNCHSNTHHGSQHNTPPHADSPPPSPHRLTPDGNQNSTQSDSNYRSNPQVPPRPPPPLRAHSASSVGSPSPVPQVLPVAEKTEPCRHPLCLNTDRTAPDHAHLTMANCNGQYGCIAVEHGELTNQQRQWDSADSIPKKKPRKSSMPVKIERVKSEGRRNQEEEAY